MKNFHFVINFSDYMIFLSSEQTFINVFEYLNLNYGENSKQNLSFLPLLFQQKMKNIHDMPIFFHTGKI